MQRYQITKFVGQYVAALGGADAIIFTGGIGENGAALREYVAEHFGFMGVKVDPALNEKMIRGNEGLISTPDSTVEVYVIPTNEELMIARDTKEIVEKM